MITLISLVTVYHRTKILHNYWLYSPHCRFHTHESFILQLEICTSISLNYVFPSPPKPLPSGNDLFVLCIYDLFLLSCYLFVCFLRFQIKVKLYSICLSLSDLSLSPWVPSPRPVRNLAAEQVVSGRRAREASSAAPYLSPSLTLEPPPPPTPPLVCGKIFFHETGPWCQKGWGPRT